MMDEKSLDRLVARGPGDTAGVASVPEGAQAGKPGDRGEDLDIAIFGLT